MLAYHLWEQVEQGETATLLDWRAAHAAARAELKPEYDALWRGYSSANDQKTLRSIVAGGGSAYRTRVIERLDLDKGSAHDAVERLLATADIERADARKYRVVDPLYAEWIATLDAGIDDGPDDD
jgi:hypothetical protein